MATPLHPSALTGLLRLLTACLVAVAGSALPGGETELPGTQPTAAGARASRVQSRRLHCLWPLALQVGRALTAPRRAPLGAVPAWSALEAAAAAEEAEAEAAKVEAQAAVQAAAQAVAQADEEAGDSKAWGVAAVVSESPPPPATLCIQAATPCAQVSEIAGGGEDVLCHTPGRIFGFVDHAGVHSQADDDGDDESPGGPRGAARSMFVDGERVPVAPGAAPFVPLLCSNSRLPPAVLRGPLRGSPALRRLVCELLRRDFLSVDVEL